MISLEAVSHWYQTGSAPSVPVLHDLNITIRQGELLCLLGPSGCGKTTLLNLIAGFISPSRGRIMLDGNEICAPGPDRGVVFQDAVLFPWLTVTQNVSFGLKLQGMRNPGLAKTVRSYLEQMGLAEHAEKYPSALSGGMCQRVALARVLALHPKVLLMDEPFSALDANSRERLQDEVLRVWTDSPRTVVYVTHSVEEAAYLAGRVLILGSDLAGIHADIPVGLDRPRDRSSGAFLALKHQLRRCLATQPCCIQPPS